VATAAANLALVATPALEAAGLTKRYGRTVGIEDLHLTVERGERFGFLGPNGAGKTTVIRLALGLIRPTAGRVAVMGHDLGTERMAALAEVGYLPGELGLVRELTGRRTLDALARLHPRPPTLQAELLRRFELGPGDLGRRVREYSRGMKQKLGLVAALQHDPPLAILDEPTASLDPVMQARLLEWLADRSRAGRTVLFSSHVLGEVEDLCDRVAMVRGGRLLLVRTVEELRRARVRRVEVTFRTPVEPSRYATNGLGPVEVAGLVHRFALRGEPAPLLTALGALPVADLTIEAPSLEDVFLAQYEDPAAAAV
jgi:ABC-2 type transport system ATP-binding protein